MRKCDTIFTQGSCPGHYGGKFDNCLSEALYILSLDSFEDDKTGSCDYEGHLSLFLQEESYGVDMAGDGTRLATVPPGWYIVFTAPNGGVSLWTYETKAEVLAEFDAWQARYETWDSQDD